MQVEIHYTWIPWDKFREPVRNSNMDHIGYCHMYIYIYAIYMYTGMNYSSNCLQEASLVQESQ